MYKPSVRIRGPEDGRQEEKIRQENFFDARGAASDGEGGRQRSAHHHQPVAEAVRFGQWTGMLCLLQKALQDPMESP